MSLRIGPFHWPEWLFILLANVLPLPIAFLTSHSPRQFLGHLLIAILAGVAGWFAVIVIVARTRFVSELETMPDGMTEAVRFGWQMIYQPEPLGILLVFVLPWPIALFWHSATFGFVARLLWSALAGLVVWAIVIVTIVMPRYRH